jgi:hypothetical protein
MNNGLQGKSSSTFSAPSTRWRTPRLGVELTLLWRLPPSLCPHLTHLKLTLHSSPIHWGDLTLTGMGQAPQLGQATNKPSGPIIAPSFSASQCIFAKKLLAEAAVPNCWRALIDPTAVMVGYRFSRTESGRRGGPARRHLRLRERGGARESERRMEEAAAAKQRERQQQAIAKVQAALDEGKRER